MRLDSLYQEIILDHYRNPRGRGLRDPYDAEAHHVNPTCGDELTVRVRMEGPVVNDVSYEGQGCSISQASASVLHELVRGKPIGKALELQGEFQRLVQARGEAEGMREELEDVLEDAVAFAGVAKYPARVKCALLGWMAWKDAVSQAATAQGLQLEETPR